MHICVVTPIPTPYRDPFWQVLSEHSDLTLAVIYCSSGRSDRPWARNAEYSYGRLFPSSNNLIRWFGWGASCFWNSGIVQILNDQHPDVVLVGGYNHLTMLKTVAWCRRTGTPWLLMSESWRRRSGVLGAIKQRWLRDWLSTAAGALPTGSLASAYLKSLGIPLFNQCLVPNVPDIKQLQELSQKIRSNPDETRQELNVPAEVQVILFAARMIEKKRPLVVIEAFSRLQGQRNLILVMLGDGPLLQSAKELASRFGIEDRIRFPGFVEPSVVHQWMSIADVFVQPSSETWGVAPIEAYVCGCSLILSNQIGCHADIINASTDGFILDRVDPNTVSEAMLSLLERNGPRGQADCRPQNWLCKNNYQAVAARLAEFLQRSAKRREAASGH